jgi:hypothetical protein
MSLLHTEALAVMFGMMLSAMHHGWQHGDVHGSNHACRNYACVEENVCVCVDYVLINSLCAAGNPPCRGAVDQP